MRRYFLLFVIIISCVFVGIAGMETFLKGESVLKDEKAALSKEQIKNLSIFVDITDNKLSIISDGKIIKTYPISSGKYSYPSPIGDWIVTDKDNWGAGFGGYWMGLNVPWGKYGIHGTNKPASIGEAASHGCIRMKVKDAEEVYKLVRYGTPVKIYGGPFGSFGQGVRLMKPGDRGADVFEIQKRLKSQGYFYGSVDGIYGESMKEAVHRFQKKNNMYITDEIGYYFCKRLGILLFD